MNGCVKSENIINSRDKIIIYFLLLQTYIDVADKYIEIDQFQELLFLSIIDVHI